MISRAVATALLLIVGVGIGSVAFAGPKASARWTGPVEFRNRSEKIVLSSFHLDTRYPSGLQIIFR